MSLMKDLKVFAMAGIVLVLLLSAPCSAQKDTHSDEKEVIESYNKTALQLYGELRKKPGNIVISPYGIGTAMAMALSGARGETGKEMAKVLNQTLTRERMDLANAKVLEKMGRFKNGKQATLSVANALCLTTHGSLVDPLYRKLVNTKYAAEIFEAKDVNPINAWAAAKTHGKIDKILKDLSANSVCVLLNAVYFKGLWASRFDKKLTRPGSFYTTGDKTLSVPMMYQTAEYPVVENDDFMAVALPYTINLLTMVIILPNERTGLATVEEKLTINTVQSTLNDLEKSKPTKVMLGLPRFKIEFGSSLIPIFEVLGMKLAFSGKADFGGVTGRDNSLGLIWIAQIQHRAFLEVNEEGSEAAAATAVEFVTKSEKPSVTKFEVDHPFLFVLVDKKTNAILFMGRVNNPLEDN